MLLASLFGKNERGTKGGHASAEKTGKGWKASFILLRLMLWGGIYMFIANVSVHGFSSPYTGLGFSLAFMGLVGLGLVKLLHYWHHG